MRATTLARRMAWRDINKSKPRSVLVISLVALPLMVMVLVATLLDSSTPSAAEKTATQLGLFDQQLVSMEGTVGMVQNPRDPSSWHSTEDYQEGAATIPAASLKTMLGAVPPGAHATAVVRGFATVKGPEFSVGAPISAGTFLDPLFSGRYLLREGNWGSDSSVLLTGDLATELGVGLGGTVSLGEEEYPVAGILEDRSEDSSLATDLAAAFGLGNHKSHGVFIAPGHPFAEEFEAWSTSVFVEGMSVTRAEQEALNGKGMGSYDRATMLGAGSAGIWGQANPDSDASDALARILVLFVIGFFVFLEVGLLAGAAFAVGARKQRRSLALLSANGAEAGTIRSISGYSGLFLGGIAVLLGTGLGLLVAWATIRWSEQFAGGFSGWHVPRDLVVALMLLALASSVIAALVPAWSVASHSALSALRSVGEGAARKPRFPVAGFVLLGLGLAAWATALFLGLGAGTYGLLQARSSYIVLGFVVGMVLCTVGMMLGIGHILSLVGKAGHRLPLAARLAIRDIQRNKGRTVPAVSAVIAGTALAAALALAVGHGVAGAGYLDAARSSSVVSVYSTGELDTANTADLDRDTAQENVVLEQLAREGHAVRANSRFGMFHDGHFNVGTDEETMDTFVALLARGSACRFGAREPLVSEKPSSASIQQQIDSMRARVEASDRFTVNYCGVDDGSNASVPGDVSVDVTDQTGLEMVLGKNYAPEVGEAFNRGSAIVTVPEFVDDGGRLTIGVPDYRYPGIYTGEVSIGSSGAVVFAPLKRTMEFDAVEVPNGGASSLPRVMVSAKAILGSGGFVADPRQMVELERSLESGEIEKLNQGLQKFGASIGGSYGPTGIDRLMVQVPWLLVIAASLLILTTAAITTGLALADGREDARVMVGVGASQKTRRRLGGVQAGLVAVLGVVLGLGLGAVPVGILMLILEGTIDTRILVPLLGLLVIPVLAAGIGWAMVERKIPGTRVGA
ncbi:FtsX-like permease family protein [Paeniglutamicibacter psychrophenolicus]|uniref:ABC transport system permease protein n=1 Tax=Paeniglutamicibacter psychrophenolicus TaxID=257454 RepID=A0ABS4WCB8_9MICC|nr:FtsX-like permease family protein [Paeniglutamicibacter psychrophenolicus]MBP2373851.1 putative ABC transport system permease protein [Paeniglutamicibacter psychrophenolicus]